MDAILLQETRTTKNWATALEERYASGWGFKRMAGQPPLSYWTSTKRAAGGVAILFHPQSPLRALRPIWDDLWGPHCMALAGQVNGLNITLVCIYAPTDRPAREALYSAISKKTLPTGIVLVGGDFNCTLDAVLDRSHHLGDVHDSPKLQHLLSRWRLVDSAASDMLAASDGGHELEFHSRTHSYWYRLADGSRASSRLDRWYVSGEDYDQVRGTTVSPPCSQSDHDAVTIELGPPDSRRYRRTGRRSIKYPVPQYAAEAVEMESSAHLEKIQDLTGKPPTESAHQWDTLKDAFRVNVLRAQRKCARKLRGSYRQRMRRLSAQLRAERARLATTTSELSLADQFDLLSLDPTARQASIRAAMISTRETHAAAKRRRKFDAYAGHGADATRAFYRRINVKYNGRRSTRALQLPTASGHSVAETLAADWTPILQQRPPTASARQVFFDRLPPVTRQAEPIPCAPFTASEVARAIADCPAGKACGPDGIPNDWYRGHITTISPILARLFSCWLAARVLPPSFAAATVCCIPKTHTPSNGLDFRPIALLNSDYKIYSRLLLTRVKASLEKTLSPTQFGFTPGRQVHDAVDVWTAIQRLVHEGLAPATTTAVLLDFAKAYDTLDRQFLSAALARHGFGDEFIHAVSDMHLETTATFLADGELSPAVDIHNGIRQGCPLAPVLFVLAIDLLYQAADVDPGLNGVRLTDEICIKLGGYADDTTSFLRHPEEEPALLKLLEDFGAASGLRVNASKCMAICMSRGGPAPAHAHMTLPVMTADRHCRLLGVSVASAPSAAYVWALTTQQLRATLHLAAIKTTDVFQRVEICKMIVMPKLLFIGRHVWPNGDTIDSLQRFIHNYVWSSSLEATPKLKRAWLSADIAVLPPRDGGVGMPSVREAFLRLSETTTTRWAQATSPTSAAIGRILLRQAPSSASHRSAGLARLVTPPPRLEATMAATGLARTRSRLALPRQDDEAALVHELVSRVGRRSHQVWDDGWLHCRYDASAADLEALFQVQRGRYGNFSIASLLAAPVAGAGILMASNGRDLRHQDCMALLTRDARIGDVLDLERCGTNHVRFLCKVEVFPLSPRTAIQFRRLCDLLVYNYPAVLRPLNPECALQPRPPTLDRWLLEREAAGIRLWLDHGSGQQVDLGVVASRVDAARRARAAGQAVVTFDPHPWLEPFVQLWNLATRPAAHHATTPASHGAAIHRVRERAATACQVDEDLGQDIQHLSWSRIARLKHSVSSQRRLLYQIKGVRLSGWARSLNARGCPHCATMGTAGGHTFHIMWHCPAAQSLWLLLLQFWRRLGVWRSDSTAATSDFRRAIFSVRLPHTPVGAIAFITSRPEPEASSALHELMEEIWVRHVLACFQTIWNWRNGTADAEAPWSYPVARSALQGRLQTSLSSAAGGISADLPAARELRHLIAACRRFFSAPSPPWHPLPPTGGYVLFFDGGSRGNPGPGGAGAVVLRVDSLRAASSIVWSAAMSLASPCTTNNQAEYLGLVTGLAAADRHRWRPLSVVGDSQLIITQLRCYRPPKNTVLRRFYHSARRLADGLGVTRWSHHLRAFNKAADAAANIAMDTRRSIQTHYPTDRPEWAGLAQLSAGDFLHWQASSPGDL